MLNLGREARKAGREISRADSGKKNEALLKIAAMLETHADWLIEENLKDVQKGRDSGLDPALLD